MPLGRRATPEELERFLRENPQYRVQGMGAYHTAGPDSQKLETVVVVIPPSVPTLEVTLPEPPSVNAMYANVPGKGRVLTPTARDFKRQASLLARHAARQQGWCYTAGSRLALDLTLYLREQRDISNAVKATEDALAVGLEFNDRYVDLITVRRAAQDERAPRCEVRLTIIDHDALSESTEEVGELL